MRQLVFNSDKNNNDDDDGKGNFYIVHPPHRVEAQGALQ